MFIANSLLLSLFAPAGAICSVLPHCAPMERDTCVVGGYKHAAPPEQVQTEA